MIDKECEHCKFFNDRYCSKHNTPVSGYDYCNDFKGAYYSKSKVKEVVKNEDRTEVGNLHRQDSETKH